MRKQGGEAEVGYLEIAFCGKKDVLGLDITMSDTLGVHVRYSADQLLKVQMGNVFPNPNIRLDLIEEIAPFGKLHGDPPPGMVLACAEELDNVCMVAKVLMEQDFEIKLLGSDASMASRIFFVDELDREEWFVGVYWDCFLDATGVSTCSMLRGERLAQTTHRLLGQWS